MLLLRRAAVAVAVAVSVAAAAQAGAQAVVGGPTVGTRAAWTSGVTDQHPYAFGKWRGEPVPIMGMFGDLTVDDQAEQWQFAHSTFNGDVDLAVGGPIGQSWAQAARGGQVAHWKQMASVLKANWHYRTVYLRYAHEANGSWMPWRVGTTETAAFRQTYRLFVATMRAELKGYDVKFVFAPNFGSWNYTPESVWPGSDVVDVVGVSMYEWADYSTPAKWRAFASSSIGPDRWLAFAAKYGKPMALSEWGARSPYFIRQMNAWMRAHAGRTGGHLIYDVYLNDRELLLKGSSASTYRALTWGKA